VSIVVEKMIAFSRSGDQRGKGESKRRQDSLSGRKTGKFPTRYYRKKGEIPLITCARTDVWGIL